MPSASSSMSASATSHFYDEQGLSEPATPTPTLTAWPATEIRIFLFCLEVRYWNHTPPATHPAAHLLVYVVYGPS